MADDAGWIKLHRALLDGPIIQHAGMLQVWVYCLLRANWEPRRVMVKGSLTPIAVDRGEFVTGRHTLHAALYPDDDKNNPVPMTVWRWLEALERMECITIRTVCNRCSVVSIRNYNTYQQLEAARCSTDVQPTFNRRSADVQPVFTDKELNKQSSSPSTSEQNKRRMAESFPTQSAGVAGIEIDGELVLYDDDFLRWEAAFAEMWNATPGTMKLSSAALTMAHRKLLHERLSDPDWHWRKALAMFPLSGGKRGLMWFLRPESVQTILEFDPDAKAIKTKGKRNDRPLTNPGQVQDLSRVGKGVKGWGDESPAGVGRGQA